MPTKKSKSPTPAKYTLTDEHRARLPAWTARWIDVVLRTAPQTADDRARVVAAMRGLYAAADLPAARGEVFCASPIGAAIAATTAACAWWLRAHPQEHAVLFGRVVSEREIAGAIPAAVAIAVARGLRAVRQEPAPARLPAVHLDAATRAATYAATHAATYSATYAATRDATDAATRAATGAATGAATDAATDAATGAATGAATDAATDAATRAATGAATYDATGAATDEATDAATYAATYDATHAATHAATHSATYAATRDATHAATRAATHAATRAATNAATGAATYAATHAATDAATYAATGDATDAATRDATGAATYAATYDATREATDAATYDATYDATHDATRAATDAATRAATYDATRAATDAATRAATYAATRDATHAATYAATHDATYAATDAATGAATDAATRAVTRAATYSATDEATRDANPAIVRFYLSAMARWGNSWNGGNQWAGWCAYLSFFRDVAGLHLPAYDRYRHYEDAAIHAGPRYTHARFWIASDFPTTIRRDAQHRPHCADGPALAWRDGWALHYWHGTAIPAAWIERPAELTPAAALGQDNVELRRCACEILGWDRVLASLPHRVLDADADPEIGTLLAIDLPDAPDERYVRARCGTGRTVYYRTDKSVATALAAAARSYGLAPHEYRPEVRT